MKPMKYTFIAALLTISMLIVAGANHERQISDRAKIYDSPQNVCPILVGTKIPDITLQDIRGEKVELMKQISQKSTVLIFYRGGWCVYCNRQLGQLMEIEKDILDAGFQIIAVSPDKPAEIQKSLDQHQMNYTLLSDSPADAAKAFGIAFRVDQPMLKILTEYKIDINKASGYDHNILPVPAVFVIDTKGVITFQYVNPAYTTRLNPSVLLAAVKAEAAKSK
jgi:peroxiredoxin